MSVTDQEVPLAEFEPAETVPALERPSSEIKRYLRKFPVAALFAIAGPLGYPVQLRASCELDDAERVMRTWPEGLAPRLAWVVWCATISDAQDVINLALAGDMRPVRRDGPRLEAPLDMVVAAVSSAAKQLGIVLTAHDVVMARAAQRCGVVAVDPRLLHEFHSRYRIARRGAAERGQKDFPDFRVLRGKLGAALQPNGEIDWAKVFEM
jgi:hypothetical protein